LASFSSGGGFTIGGLTAFPCGYIFIIKFDSWLGGRILGKKILNKIHFPALFIRLKNFTFLFGSLRKIGSLFCQRRNLVFLPLVFFCLIPLGVNLNERRLSSLWVDVPFFSREEIENFVTSIAPFTSVLEEEPSLAAYNVAGDSLVSDTDYIEKPNLSTTIVSENIQKVGPRTEMVKYTVSSLDTLSQISKKFGISVKTLATVNNLSSVHQIKTGQILLIPPAEGIIHTVARGETLASIVKKYQGDLSATLKFTDQEIFPGEKVLVVNGKMPEITPQPRPYLASARESLRQVVVRESSPGRLLGSGGNRKNGYPWGWCTWYAAYRRNVPSGWGNARSWLSSAQRSGYATGATPRVGAIVVTTDNSFWGHVAYVEAVEGGSIIVSEMNYQGFGIISRRSIPINSRIIRGYIY